MDSQVSVASSTVESQVSEDLSSEEDDEDIYDDYYGKIHIYTQIQIHMQL